MVSHHSGLSNQITQKFILGKQEAKRQKELKRSPTGSGNRSPWPSKSPAADTGGR